MQERPVYPIESRLLAYLPDIYSYNEELTESSFLERFLCSLETIWLPLERQLNQLYCYFDPLLTPSELLPWLASWMDIVLEEDCPDAVRRQLISNAAELYEWRGTARGLSLYLMICLGYKPQIELDEAGEIPCRFIVTFPAEALTDLNWELVNRIIEQEKPAHTIYMLPQENHYGRSSAKN